MYVPRQRRRLRGYGLLAGALCIVAPTACVQVLGLERLPPTPPATGEAGPPADGSDAVSSADSTPCVDGSAALQSDGNNCGRCGHDCLGGGCNAGRCQPVLLVGSSDVRSLALDDSYVYYASYVSGSVSRVPKRGGPSTTLGTAQAAWGIDVGPTHIVWTSATGPANGGGVYRCPKDGCGGTPERVVVGDFAADVVLAGDRSGTTFAFAELGAGQVSLWEGASSRVLASPGQPYRIAVDATHVYIKSFASFLERVPLSGGASTDVGPAFSNTAEGGVAIHAGRVYWTGGDRRDRPGFVRSAATSNVADQANYANSAVLPYCVAADDKRVYWGSQGQLGSQNGAVYACPVVGCTQPDVLAQGFDEVLDLEVDDDAVYFGLRAGGVYRLAKP